MCVHICDIHAEDGSQQERKLERVLESAYNDLDELDERVTMRLAVLYTN